jgi:hypothetical protein
MKQPCVDIMASKRQGTLYPGVTSNLPKRAFEHREGLVSGFSAKYGCKILVWYELHETMIRSNHSRKADQGGKSVEEIGADRSPKSGMDRPLRVTDMRLSETLSPSLRAKRSNPSRRLRSRRDGLLRRFAPRNDGGGNGRRTTKDQE